MKTYKILHLNQKGLAYSIAVAIIAISSIAAYGSWRVYNSYAIEVNPCGSGYKLNKTQRSSTGVLRQYTKKVSGGSYQSCVALFSLGDALGKEKQMKVGIGEKDGYTKSVSKTSKNYVGPVYGWATYAKGSMTYKGKTTNYSFVISGM